jgi:hypothetical protein
VVAQRPTVTEFDSVEQAIAAHNSPAYQEALRALGNTCERDVRIVGERIEIARKMRIARGPGRAIGRLFAARA